MISEIEWKVSRIWLAREGMHDLQWKLSGSGYGRETHGWFMELVTSGVIKCRENVYKWDVHQRYTGVKLMRRMHI